MSVEPTPLARQLAGDEQQRPVPLDAFKAARRTFMGGQRIEMAGLADQLGISRVTLHRWVGSRDQLLGEVLWSLGEPTLHQAREATIATGGAGIAETFERFLRTVQEHPQMRQFLAREPDIALRVLTTKHTHFQQRLVESIRSMLECETAQQRLEPLMDLGDLAYIVVRLGESFFYNDIITGGEPDLSKARQAIAHLLR
jgi:hypothetical protein